MKSVRVSDAYMGMDRQVEIREDFLNGVTSTAFAGAAASGAVAALDERGGGVSLTTQAADNAVGTLTSSAKLAVLAAGKPLHFAARIQFAEAATDAANLFVGLFSGTVADAVGNNGAGPPANYSGIGFFKVDGETEWNVEASVSTTQRTQKLNADGSLTDAAVVAGNANYQLLEIEVLPKTATKADVMFKVDGATVAKFTDWTYTSIAAMALVAVVRAGSASAEVLKTDFIKFCQVR